MHGFDRIVVASRNPVKLEAVRRGLQRAFPKAVPELLPVSVPSGVSDQPLTDDETRRGAAQRARGAATAVPDADAWVGIEGGIQERDGRMEAFAWVVIISRGSEGESRTASFVLPQAVSDLVRAGKELGEADDIVFGRSNSKQQEGAVGLLTGRAVLRSELYEQAVTLALVPFLNPELYNVQDAVRPFED